MQDEPVPKWISSIRISGLEEAESILDEYKSIIAFQEGIIDKLKRHYRLLYAHGNALQDAVSSALKLLGLDDLKKGRKDNKEDLVFDFQSPTQYAHGVIMVKGSEQKADLDQLRQCQSWADDYVVNGKKSKPIFIMNQLRFSPYPESRKERMVLDKTLDDFAREKKICVIPTFLLFEAVNKALKGYKTSRADLEKLIAETNGILTDFG